MDVGDKVAHDGLGGVRTVSTVVELPPGEQFVGWVLLDDGLFYLPDQLTPVEE